MDWLFLFSSSLLAIIFLPFSLLGLRASTKPKNVSSNLPPGPRRLPIIGNIHQLVGSLPHHALRQLAEKHGPIMCLQLGEISTIVVSSAELAKEVLKTHDVILAGRPAMLSSNIITYGFKDLAFAPYGEYWRQMKKIFMLELLSAKRVESFGSIREDEVSNLIRNISSKTESPINLSKMLSSLTIRVISKTAFGNTIEPQTFVRLVDNLSQMLDGFCISDIFPSYKLLHLITGEMTKLRRLHREVDCILEDVISECRTNGSSGRDQGDCIVDALSKIQDQGILQLPFTSDNIKAIVLDIFAGGSDTSSVVLQWAMAEMLKNPAALERVQTEVRQVFVNSKKIDEASLGQLRYLKSVVKETLRLHPPFPLLFPRESRERVEIDGYEIPSRTKILVNAWAIGRDPHYWTEAEKFCPERFLDNPIDYKGTDYKYIPFGAGRRICPGINKAITIVELTLANLLYHFDWKLPNGLSAANLDMSEACGAATHRKNDLYLIPTSFEHYELLVKICPFTNFNPN
ncbi:hypothetical protein K2173_006422 [Erythroxylum novogranatense]|uniref:Cytochrome P450 n=1 Tax=Erythroxylum novogranatense TaxID=1862640 RepID=A0AAV8U3B1_9ROSI|nr:hypothetical protein K2173_006422 [Erythroxylum novogranatense]